MRYGPLAAALLLLGACNEDTPSSRAIGTANASPASSAADARVTEALRVTDERLRTRLRTEGNLTQRAVQVHRQAMANTVAVCGQVNMTGQPDQPFIPYVSVISFEGDRAARGDLHLGASTPEATRVYIEMVDRCFDGGGPSHARAAGRPMPPAPNGLPTTRDETVTASATAATSQTAAAATSQTAAAAAPPPPAETPIGITVVRSAANVRAAPSGSGAVLRTAPRGAALQVFAEAPGGWLQVGDAVPWGWVHGSLLQAP